MIAALVLTGCVAAVAGAALHWAVRPPGAHTARPDRTDGTQPGATLADATGNPPYLDDYRPTTHRGSQ